MYTTQKQRERGDGGREREGERETDRQKQRDRQTDRQTDRQRQRWDSVEKGRSNVVVCRL